PNRRRSQLTRARRIPATPLPQENPPRRNRRKRSPPLTAIQAVQRLQPVRRNPSQQRPLRQTPRPTQLQLIQRPARSQPARRSPSPQRPHLPTPPRPKTLIPVRNRPARRNRNQPRLPTQTRPLPLPHPRNRTPVPQLPHPQAPPRPRLRTQQLLRSLLNPAAPRPRRAAQASRHLPREADR